MKNFNKRVPSFLHFIRNLCTSLDNMVFNGDVSDAFGLLTELDDVLRHHESLYLCKLEKEDVSMPCVSDDNFDFPF